MKEIETKIIKIDVELIRDKILILGGTLVKLESQINDIYDFRDGSLMKDKGYARIRRVFDKLNNEEKIYMTVKKLITKIPYKIMDEHEILISDAKEAHLLLSSLGLLKIKTIKKERESFKLLNSLIEIDINEPSICPFPYLEIESKDEEELNKIVELLGYKYTDTFSQTLDEILKLEGVFKN